MSYRKSKLSEDELAYFCRFYEIDGPMHMHFIFNLRYSAISKLWAEMVETESVQHYKELWEAGNINRLERG